MSSLLIFIVGAAVGSAFVIVADAKGWLGDWLPGYKAWVLKNYEERLAKNDSGEERTESELNGGNGTDGGEDQSGISESISRAWAITN